MRQLGLQILIVAILAFCVASVAMNINANNFWETLGFAIGLTIAFFLAKPFILFLVLSVTIIAAELFLFIKRFFDKKVSHF